MKDPDSSLLWMIPLSSKIDKYKAIYDKDIINHGKCIAIVLGRFAGKDAAFLLQDMFPIHEAYLSSAYTVKTIRFLYIQQSKKKLTKKLSSHYGAEKWFRYSLSRCVSY